MQRTGIAILALCAVGSAQAGVFDFESLSTGATGGFIVSDSGVTATFSTPNGSVQDISFVPPAGWGVRTLWGGDQPAVFSATFDTGLSFIGFEFGDYGGDDDSVHLRAYDSGNNLVGSADFNWGGGDLFVDPVGTLGVVSATAITKIEFWGVGLDGTNSLYMDNFTFRAVPEPATVLALGAGVAALARRRRK